MSLDLGLIHVLSTLLNGTVFWKSVGDFDYVFDASPRQLIVGFDVGSFGLFMTWY